MDVLVLAGGKCDPELASATGQTEKWAVTWNGRTFFDTVVEATEGQGRIVSVGGPEHAPNRAEPGSSFIQSLANGLAKVESEKFLLVTADLPFLTKEAVDSFLAVCPPTADIAYPIVPMADCLAAFPTLARTSLRLADGEFTGGNMAVFRTDETRGFLPILERGYAARKSPFDLAKIVGPGMLFSLLLGKLLPSTLRLRDLERKVGAFLGSEVRGVIVSEASVGTDIDTAEQFQALLALKHLGSVPKSIV